MSWTASSAQTGKEIPDTIKCYGITELKWIAAGLVEGKACDTALAITKSKLENRESLIVQKDSEIGALNKQLSLKESIIDEKDKRILVLNDQLSSEIRKKKWLKFGWGATSAVLTGVLAFFIIN